MIVDNGREVVIRVRGLAKSFGSHQIWDGLSLDVYRGEILAIVGGSGQGKSVLMRVITGLVRPDTGDVGLFGQNTEPAQGVLLAGFALLFYTPIAYATDNFVYKRYLKRQQQNKA